ncbi:MAG: hypothetical protein ABIN80_11950 [Dyadobacter sp.]|uniref:hypothetical protein n=1 Tax=Dyadobacter sp. TaxID=1914288 RepID=UPI0032674F96
MDMVDYHLVKPFAVLNDTFEKQRLDIHHLKSEILARKDIAIQSGNEKQELQCNGMIKRVDGQNYAYEICKDSAENEKRLAKDKIDNKFPYISFLLALFCISVLVLATSQSPHKHVTLLLVDISLYVCYKKIKSSLAAKKAFTYWDISFSYLCFLSVCVIVHFTVGFFVPKPIIDTINYYETAFYLKRMLVFTNVIIPFSHFGYYLLSFKNKTRDIEKTSREQLKLIEEMKKNVRKELDAMKIEKQF